MTFLGHEVSEAGIAMDAAKVQAVIEWQVPMSKTDIRSFLSLTGYYRKFVKDYATIAKPLNALTEKDKRWQWHAGHQSAFDHLKAALVAAPLLAYPQYEEKAGEFIFDVDASDVTAAGILS